MEISHIHFYHLSFVPDHDEIMIGRADIGSYAAFPENGAALIKKMQNGMSTLDAAAWYKHTYNEEVDMSDFVDTLLDLQFIHAGEEELQEKLVRPVSLLWQRIGKLAFSPGAWIVYVLLLVACLSMMFRLPRLIPGYHNLFFSPFASVIEIGIFFGDLPGLLFHEFYHSLSGKRHGLPTRLGIGHRANYIVFETDMTAIWSIPRNQRYLPFLAGIVADVVYFSLQTLVAGLLLSSGTSWLAFIGAFCLALATATLFRILWQLNFYLQTDLYYIFSSLFGCINLQNTAKAYLLNRFWSVVGRADKMTDEGLWHVRDRRLLPWYLPFFLGGYAVTLCLFVYGLLPFLFQLFSLVFVQLKVHAWKSISFWDACLFLAMNIAEITLMIVVVTRDYRRKRKMSLPRSTVFSH